MRWNSCLGIDARWQHPRNMQIPHLEVAMPNWCSLGNHAGIPVGGSMPGGIPHVYLEIGSAYCK